LNSFKLIEDYVCNSIQKKKQQDSKKDGIEAFDSQTKKIKKG